MADPVEFIYDGDTSYKGKQGYRTAGVDTPEMKAFGDESPQAGGVRARDRWAELKEQHPDAEQIVLRKDPYGRNVTKTVAKDGTDLSRIMVQEGYAVPMNGFEESDDYLLDRTNYLVKLQNGEVDNVLEGGQLTPPPKKVQQATVAKELSKGVGRGVDTTKGLFATAAQTAAEVMGFDGMAAKYGQLKNRYMEEAQENVPEVGSVYDVDSWKDGAMYVAGMFGENLPQFGFDAAIALGTGGAGTAAALARRSVADVAMKRAEGTLLKPIVSAAFKRSATEATARDVFKKYAKTGAFGSQYAQAVGDAQQELEQNGVTDGQTTALIAGLAPAMLDYTTTKALFRTAARAAKKGEFEQVGSIFKEGLKHTGLQGANEAFTEMVNKSAVAYHVDGFDMMSDDNIEDYVNAALGGAFFGSASTGMIGGSAFIRDKVGKRLSRKEVSKQNADALGFDETQDDIADEGAPAVNVSTKTGSGAYTEQTSSVEKAADVAKEQASKVEEAGDTVAEQTADEPADVIAKRTYTKGTFGVNEDQVPQPVDELVGELKSVNSGIKSAMYLTEEQYAELMQQPETVGLLKGLFATTTDDGRMYIHHQANTKQLHQAMANSQPMTFRADSLESGDLEEMDYYGRPKKKAEDTQPVTPDSAELGQPAGVEAVAFMGEPDDAEATNAARTEPETENTSASDSNLTENQGNRPREFTEEQPQQPLRPVQGIQEALPFGDETESGGRLKTQEPEVEIDAGEVDPNAPVQFDLDLQIPLEPESQEAIDHADKKRKATSEETTRKAYRKAGRNSKNEGQLSATATDDSGRARQGYDAEDYTREVDTNEGEERDVLRDAVGESEQQQERRKGIYNSEAAENKAAGEIRGNLKEDRASLASEEKKLASLEKTGKDTRMQRAVVDMYKENVDSGMDELNYLNSAQKRRTKKEGRVSKKEATDNPRAMRFVNKDDPSDTRDVFMPAVVQKMLGEDATNDSQYKSVSEGTVDKRREDIVSDVVAMMAEDGYTIDDDQLMNKPAIHDSEKGARTLGELHSKNASSRKNRTASDVPKDVAALEEAVTAEMGDGFEGTTAELIAEARESNKKLDDMATEVEARLLDEGVSTTPVSEQLSNEFDAARSFRRADERNVAKNEDYIDSTDTTEGRAGDSLDSEVSAQENQRKETQSREKFGAPRGKKKNISIGVERGKTPFSDAIKKFIVGVADKANLLTPVEVVSGTVKGGVAEVRNIGSGLPRVVIDMDKMAEKYPNISHDMTRLAVAHEVGHIFTRQMMYSMPDSTVRGLYAEFEKAREGLGKDHTYWKENGVGFDEFLADQFGLYMNGQADLDSSAKSWFRKVAEGLQKIANTLADMFGRTRLTPSENVFKLYDGMIRGTKRPADFYAHWMNDAFAVQSAPEAVRSFRANDPQATRAVFEQRANPNSQTNAAKNEALDDEITKAGSDIKASIKRKSARQRKAEREQGDSFQYTDFGTEDEGYYMTVGDAAADTDSITKMAYANTKEFLTNREVMRDRMNSTWDFTKKALSPIFGTADGELRRMGQVGKIIADKYKQAFDDTSSMRSVYLRKLERAIDATNPEDMEKFASGKADVPAPIAKFLQSVHNQISDSGTNPTVGWIKDYFPRLYDIEQIDTRRDEFVKFLMEEAADAGVAMDEVSARNITSSLVSGDTMFTQYADMKMSLHGPSFQNGKLRQLDFINDKRLREKGFAQRDIVNTLNSYTARALKQAQFQKQFAGWNTIQSEVEFETRTGKTKNPSVDSFLYKMLMDFPLKNSAGKNMDAFEKEQAVTPSSDHDFQTKNAKYIKQMIDKGFLSKSKKGEFQYFDRNKHLRRYGAMLDTQNPAHLERLSKVVDAYEGRLGADTLSPQTRDLMSGMMAYQNATTMVLSGFSAIPDMAGVVFRSRDFRGMLDSMDEIRKLYMTVEGREKRALIADLGFAEGQLANQALLESYGLQHMSGFAQSFNDKLFKYNGTRALSNMSRVMGAAMAERFIKRNAKRAMDGDERAKRYMQELGLTPEEANAMNGEGFKFFNEYVDSGDVGESASDASKNSEKIHRAMHAFVDSAMVRPNATQRPVWGSDPRWMLIWHLKSFMYSYGKVILGGLGKEMRARWKETDGSIANKMWDASIPAMVYTVPMLATSALALSMRQVVQYDIWGDEEPTEEMDWLPYLAEISKRGGVLGPLEMGYSFVDSTTSNRSGVAQLMGPTVGHLETMLSFDADKMVNRSIPVVSQIPALKRWMSAAIGGDE